MQAMIDYCDNWLGIRRIELEVFANNPDGLALYENSVFSAKGLPAIMHSATDAMSMLF